MAVMCRETWGEVRYGRIPCGIIMPRSEKQLDIIAYADWIGGLAKTALLEEVYTEPKPGLVDPFSSGAHRDMDLHAFERSAQALEPYFARMAKAGLLNSGDPQHLFQIIRRIGIQAEKAMYQATDGVNTHKGAIFTIGILCAAAGACQALYGNITTPRLIQMEQRMVRETLLNEISQIFGMSETLSITNGQRNFRRYGALGVRGEAAFGYPTVTQLALPVLQKGLKEKKNWNRTKLQAAVFAELITEKI